jgi:hypothetical protein
MRRLASTVVAVLALLVPAPAALAQGNPFTPPQPAVPSAEPAPTATPPESAVDTGTRTLYVIAGALLVVFVFIGFWIARDARRSAPRHERHRGARAIAEPVPGEPRPRRKDPREKQRARRKARAQRRARRRNR